MGKMVLIATRWGGNLKGGYVIKCWLFGSGILSVFLILGDTCLSSKYNRSQRFHSNKSSSHACKGRDVGKRSSRILTFVVVVYNILLFLSSKEKEFDLI